MNRFRKVKDDAELTQVGLVYGQPQILGLLNLTPKIQERSPDCACLTAVASCNLRPVSESFWLANAERTFRAANRTNVDAYMYERRPCTSAVVSAV